MSEENKTVEGEVQAEKSKLISGTVTSEVKKKPAAVCMIMSDDEIW